MNKMQSSVPLKDKDAPRVLIGTPGRGQLITEPTSAHERNIKRLGVFHQVKSFVLPPAADKRVLKN